MGARRWRPAGDHLANTVYGFRTDGDLSLTSLHRDAAEVLDACCEGAAYERLTMLVVSAFTAGIAPPLVAFAAHLRGQSREGRPTTAAVTALLLVELAVGGSYWRDYPDSHKKRNLAMLGHGLLRDLHDEAPVRRTDDLDRVRAAFVGEAGVDEDPGDAVSRLLEEAPYLCHLVRVPIK